MQKRTFLLTIFIVTAFIGCETEEPTGIWDKDEAGAPDPVINTVTPPDSTYGGIDRKTVVIGGKNFSNYPEENLVYFGAELAEIIQASETELTVYPPINFQDSLALKVAVSGAYLFGTYTHEINGNTVPRPYKLKNPVTRPGTYSKDNAVGGFCVDKDENVYISRKLKIDKITPDGTKIENIGELRRESNNIKIGPGGAFYYTATLYIFKTDTSDFTHEYKRLSAYVNDLDFDAGGNLFLAGVESVYYANPYDVTEPVELVNVGDTTFTVVRVYDNELYLVGNYTGSDTTISSAQKIWKYQIDFSGDTLTKPIKTVLDFTGTEYSNIKINSLTFTKQGRMYIGTKNNSLLYVDQPYSVSGLTPLYPKFLSSEAIFRMAWGTQDYLYVNNKNESNPDANTFYKIRMFENGAPYYGRQ